MDNELDKAGGAATHKNINCQKYLNKFCLEWGLSDVYRLNNPSTRMYTHFDKQFKTSTRLDFFLVDDRLINLPTCVSNITHGFSTDHSYVTLSIGGTPLKHGPGYWKFNNSHLSSEEFTQSVKAIINDTVSSSYDSYNGLWDTIKFKIKSYAISYGKSIRKFKHAHKVLLQERIASIKDYPNYHDFPDKLSDLSHLESQLDKIIKEEMDGVILRSKAQWVEKGERCTKYFFGLEKSNGKKKSIQKLIDSQSGEPIHHQDKISDEVVKFYGNIFRSTDPPSDTVNSYIDSSTVGSIPPTLADTLDEFINMEELDQVVNSLKNNKSPGWDGLSAEFYKHFWSDIKEIIFKCFEESVVNQRLSPSQRIGIITLLPKPKPPTELVHLKNWRPITLLNVDYKIFTHIIKNRIIQAIPHLVSKVQTGFQAGKCTSDNLILLCLTLENFHNNENEGGILLQVDFERAFDSVEHQFLFKTLERMGFGENIIGMVKTAFHGCLSYVNVNGYLSHPVYLGRGLHQGSPLSPILFLLISQVFTKKLEINENIIGMRVSGIDILLSLYADDTDIFLSATATSLEAVLGELRAFGTVSGCKCNIDKTKCVPLGSTKYDSNLINFISNKYGSDFLTNKFTALGVDFDNVNTIQKISDDNFLEKFERAKSRTKYWGSRDLTIFGKVTIIKTIIMSQFVYLFIPLPRPSNKQIQNLTKFIFNFLWGGKPDKIKRDIVTRDREYGGLNMIYPSDFILSLKLKLLQKIGDLKFRHPWKSILINQLNHPEHIGICFENQLVTPHFTFTYDLVSSYIEWRDRCAAANSKGVNQCVWGNKHITDIGSKLWQSKLIECNVNYISDFVDEKGYILTYDDFCIKTLNRSFNIITSREYVDIKMAIRRYDNPANPLCDLKNIDHNLCLSFFINNINKQLRGANIRDCLSPKLTNNEIQPLISWARDLDAEINWNTVLKNMYTGIARNLKVVQFQYKLIMNISTCRYKRYKMKIDKVSPRCFHCDEELETLPHIFLRCEKTLNFNITLERFIIDNIQHDFQDPHRVHFITCNHDNVIINYIMAVSKQYISHCFQLQKDLRWDHFKNYVSGILVGEREPINSNIISALGLM